MPSPTPALSRADVRRFVEERCLTLSERRHVGVELEWFTHPTGDPTRHVPFELVHDVVTGTHLPADCIRTFEPGGQIELSSQPEADARAACNALRRDGEAIRAALAPHDIELLPIGMDPWRPFRRVIDAPRYRAMEAFFDADGPAGRRMMRGTAAIQINLEAGTEADANRRWQLAHALGPTLGAAFANSPLAGGRPTGWRSGRMATWWAIDSSRTAPAVSDRPPVDAWERYLLNARVMMIRASGERFVPITEPLPFARWLDDGHELGYPTVDDLDYHTTTLFPPVRLRGWLELRFLDALPDPWWHVAVAVTTALLDDEEAAAAATHACAPAADLWHQAARNGLAHPVLSLAAKECFAAAQEALDRRGAERATTDAVAGYYDRFVARARTPADEHLDAWRATADGAVVRLDREPADAGVAWI